MPAFAHEPAFRIVLVTVFCWPIVADQEPRISGFSVSGERPLLAELRPRHLCTVHKLNVSKDMSRKKRAISRTGFRSSGWVYPVPS